MANIVTNIKAIRSTCNGTIEYKPDFNHEYSDWILYLQKKRNKIRCNNYNVYC